jgi:hypothetical protein
MGRRNPSLPRTAKIDRFMQDASLVKTRDATRAYLKKDGRSRNYTVRYDVLGEVVRIEYRNFSDFEQFDKFVCGHFHKSREEDDCYDAGCFLYSGAALPRFCKLIPTAISFSQ